MFWSLVRFWTILMLFTVAGFSREGLDLNDFIRDALPEA